MVEVLKEKKEHDCKYGVPCIICGEWFEAGRLTAKYCPICKPIAQRFCARMDARSRMGWDDIFRGEDEHLVKVIKYHR